MAKRRYYRLDGSVEELDEERTTESLKSINSRMQQNKPVRTQQVQQTQKVAQVNPTVTMNKTPTFSRTSTINQFKTTPDTVQPTITKPKEVKKETEEYKQSQENLKQANKRLDNAEKVYRNALSLEYKKNNISFTPELNRPTNKISYQTKETDKLQSQPENQAEQISKAYENTAKEREEVNKASNDWLYANYLNNVEKVKNEDTTMMDRLTTPIRAMQDLVSPVWETGNNKYIDEEGNVQYLPNYYALKQQQVRQDTPGVGGALMDIGYNTTKILGANAIDKLTGGFGGKALYWTDMAVDNYQNVRNQGYSNEQAIANTIISTGSEFLTEKLLGGIPGLVDKGYKGSELQKILANVVYKQIKNPKIANIIASMGSEGLEEFTQEFIDAINDKITLGEDKDIVQLIKDAFYSGLIGAGSGGLTTSTNNVEGRIVDQNLKEINPTIDYLKNQKENTKKKSELKKIDAALSEAEGYAEKPFTKNFKKTKESVESSLEKINPNIRTFSDAAESVRETQREQEALKNDKIQTFRESVAKENIQDKDGFYKAVEKIIADKDYNVVLDSSITNKKGDAVNALISNENGITIKINPNSERAGEILLMHEVTHGIETKEMSNLIMDYASKNSEFNSALEDLKSIYGTKDVTPEVVADISGQLFGNQEFINNLSTEKPTLFKQIYDKIIEIANKLTGNSNKTLFMKDLKNKWEKAYRESNLQTSKENLKKGVKYSQNADITDNKGRPLDIKQQNYFENSQATDDKGKLVTLYHTTTDMTKQFNVFNPAESYKGDYKFGKYNVTYLTDSEDMSESYSMYEPRKADTRRLKNLDEAREYLENTSLNLVDIENTNQAIKNHFKNNDNRYFLVSGDLTTFGEYKTEEELLRDVIPTAQQVMRGDSNFKYEVYANITKPYIIDAEGRNWDKITREINEESKKVVDSLSNEQKSELAKYANESLDKHQEWLMSDEYSDYLRYEDTYSKLNNTTSENLVIFSMKKSLYDKDLTANDYIEFYKEYGSDGKSPDSKITVGDQEMTFAEFAAKWANLDVENGKYAFNYSYFMSEAAKKYGDDLRTVGVEKMFDMAKYNFKDWAVEDTLSSDLKTNDIVKKVLKMNENGENYDGIIFKNTTDYGVRNGEEAHDVYVVFNPNQIKAVDNLDPTDDPDIRYSKKAQKWQQYLEKNFPSRGTTTQLREKKGAALSEAVKNKKETNRVVKESFKTQKETKVEATKQEKGTSKSNELAKAMDKVKKGTATEKDRSYIRTVMEAQHSEEYVKQMEDFLKTYEVISNKQSMQQAEAQLKNYKTLDAKVNHIEGILNSGKRITAADITAAQLVLRDAMAAKNVKQYNRVLADMGILETEYGQVLQASSQIRKLSPINQLDVLEKIINREKASGNKAYRNVEVTDDMKNRLFDCFDKDGNVNQEQFDNTMEEIKQELADEIKVGAGEKVRTWRYLSMLGNPKTHIRNEVANLSMSTVKYIKDNISGAMQDVFIRNKQNKTRTLKSSSKDVKSLANSTYNEISSETVGNKYNEKSDLEVRTKVFKTRWLEAVRKFNDKMLSAEDQGFKKINYKRAFANYLTAQGISTQADIEANPQIVERAKLFAMEEANVATFNQKNKLAEFINSGDKKLGPIYRVMRGAIIPFTRTPLNIAKTGIEYTPGAGMASLAYDVYKAPSNMKGTVFIDGLSKQLTGTALALAGYALAKSGRVKAKTDKDKEGYFEQDQGTSMDYSIKFGDTSYDLSWLSPSAMPFFVGARVFEIMDKQEGIDENIILESLASTVDPLSEMSCISSFNKVLKSYNQEGGGAIKDMLVTTGQNYLSQFVPTFSGQIARFFDDTKRTTTPDVGAPNKISQETYRTLAYKIPGLRNTLPESTDYYGRKKEEYNSGFASWLLGKDESWIDRLYNSFVSPTNKRRDTMSEEDKELLRLASKTGNEDIIPSALSKNQTVKFNDKNFKMTRKEYNEYKKDFGDTFEDNLKDLMSKDEYQEASDDEKAEMISGLMKYSKDKTKDDFLTDKGEDYVKISKKGTRSPYESDKVNELTDSSFGISDYYIYKASSPNIVNGKVEDVKKRLNLIEAFNIDNETYSKYMTEIGDITADVDKNGKTIQGSRKKKIFDYINSLDLTKQQKIMLMKKEYSSYRGYDRELYNIINNSNLTKEEKESLRDFLKIGR